MASKQLIGLVCMNQLIGDNKYIQRVNEAKAVIYLSSQTVWSVTGSVLAACLLVLVVDILQRRTQICSSVSEGIYILFAYT